MTFPVLVLVGILGCAPPESEVELRLPPGMPPPMAAGVDASVHEPPPGTVTRPASKQVCALDKPPRAAPLVPYALRQGQAISDSTLPPISGGTLISTADGSTVVAADPERDQLYFVDVADARLLHTRVLDVGDEPGRLVEDAAGRIHVVLRRAGAIASLDREPGSAITRRRVCALPRGIAYDPVRDQLHIACAEGKLVTLAAEPSEHAPLRALELWADLRDVLVRGDQLFVTRFRAAELLELSANGLLQDIRKPPSFAREEDRPIGTDDSCTVELQRFQIASQPNVAWRALDVPGKGISMLHQRSRLDELPTSEGGYGFAGCESGIVQTSVSLGLDSDQPLTADIGEAALAVDFAVNPAGTRLVLVAPGNFGLGPQLQSAQLGWFEPPKQDLTAPGPVIGRESAGCLPTESLVDPRGQITAVSFIDDDVFAVLEREPAAISIYTLYNRGVRRVDLHAAPRFDTGHAIFHSRTDAGLACASCHPEATDDGHIWSFQGIGPRRTQSLRGGLLGTEPLHWNGDMANFGMLIDEVFVARMSGFRPTPEQADALASWLHAQPALRAESTDAAAAERGKLLFESEQTGCTRCHAGDQLTNNLTEDVGTGVALQVPSLKGVRFRAPWMHDGCAATLAERFTDRACGGGDKHGTSSQLSMAEISDLIAYLETL